jgi:Questin oxidase-like
LYDEESRILEPWTDSPHEVTRVDWSRYVGDKRFARAFVDFFEDEVVRSNYDWKRVVQRYVVEGEEPLLSGMISGGTQECQTRGR